MDPIREAFLKDYKSDAMFKIVEILDRANQFGLTTEVVVTALKEMKENPPDKNWGGVYIATSK